MRQIRWTSVLARWRRLIAVSAITSAITMFGFEDLTLAQELLAGSTDKLAHEFSSDWSTRAEVERRWIGEQYWANRLQDWRLSKGRLICEANPKLPMRSLHLLDFELKGTELVPSDGLGTGQALLKMSVVVGGSASASNAPSPGASAGFLLGCGGAQMDPRAAAVIHQWEGNGAGFWAGFESTANSTSQLVLRSLEGQDGRWPPQQNSRAIDHAWADPVRLQLEALRGESPGSLKLQLEAWAIEEEQLLGRASALVSEQVLQGNLGLGARTAPAIGNGNQEADAPSVWFQDWRGSGPALLERDLSFGPVATAQYCLDARRGAAHSALKLTAQLTPMGNTGPEALQLEVEREDGWLEVARAVVERNSWTATFRVPDWNAEELVPYRVVCIERRKQGVESIEGARKHLFYGSFAADPGRRDEVVVCGFTGNHNNSHSIGGGWGRVMPNPDAKPKDPGPTAPNDWVEGMWFPHADVVERVRAAQPDFLFFSGDQVYEGKSPTFADTRQIELDYLYKWYLWCWAWRDLTRNIPCATIPDDHDVYQGNVWGQGGRKAPGRDTTGGYVHPATFVNLVHRTQTSHLPDPLRDATIEQDISYYPCDWVWGRVSFAVLADRMFKSGCQDNGLPPSGSGRADHYNNPEFDTSELDLPQLELLGERQLALLEKWSVDWSGAEMKLLLSQTAFASLASHHGPKLSHLIADLDSNGWPQTGRRKALELVRRCFAVHLCGDQHLATLVQHGLDKHNDGPWSFCVPSVANFYPRAWAPECEGPYRCPEPEQYQGERRDGFGNRITVHAATNPGAATGQGPTDLHDNMPGFGVVRISKQARNYTFECWPRHPELGQYEGWPRTVQQLENWGPALGHLAEIKWQALDEGEGVVLRVFDEELGLQVYSLRLNGQSFRPPVYRDSSYRVTLEGVQTKLDLTSWERSGLRMQP